MNATSKCSFHITSWEEQIYHELAAGARLAHAKVRQCYAGAIEGSGSVDLLLSYGADGIVNFAGLEHITCVLAGRKGSFVIRHQGTVIDRVARSAWSIVPGTGTAELAHLQGSGNYVARVGESGELNFTYYCHSQLRA